VRTTGNHSELRETIPISRRSGGERRVVMSMGPALLPDLVAGDRLTVTAEVQATLDCYGPAPRCAGAVYHFNPRVVAKLVLAPDRRRTGGSDALGLDRKRVICRQRLPNRQHHCPLVFTNAGLQISDRGDLPCSPDSCHINLVLSAHHRRADGRERLIVGGTKKASGRVPQDRGRINAIRLRRGWQSVRSTVKTRRRLRDSLRLDLRKRVVFSKRLEGLEAGEQLAVEGTMKSDVSHLPFNALVGSQLILASGRRETRIDQFVRGIASLKGEIDEMNGFNCTQAKTPCRTTKVGVVRVREDARFSGARVPLFVNFIVRTKEKRARADRGDELRILYAGGLTVHRYAR
jgi:hypothetical protein